MATWVNMGFDDYGKCSSSYIWSENYEFTNTVTNVDSCPIVRVFPATRRVIYFLTSSYAMSNTYFFFTLLATQTTYNSMLS